MVVNLSCLALAVTVGADVCKLFSSSFRSMPKLLRLRWISTRICHSLTINRCETQKDRNGGKLGTVQVPLVVTHLRKSWESSWRWLFIVLLFHSARIAPNKPRHQPFPLSTVTSLRILWNAAKTRKCESQMICLLELCS